MIKKKIITMLLCVAMLMTCTIIPVFAAEEPEDTSILTAEAENVEDLDVSESEDNSKALFNITDLSNDELYDVNSKDVYLNLSDTISSADVEVTINEEAVEILKDKGGKEYFTIPSGLYQTISVTATDKAGNSDTALFLYVTVSESFFTKIITNRYLVLGLVVILTMVFLVIAFAVSKFIAKRR